MVLRLTLRQTNIIQDEINSCFYQSKNAVNVVRHSCDKFEKFGAVVHLCGTQTWYSKSKNICFEINFDPSGVWKRSHDLLKHFI